MLSDITHEGPGARFIGHDSYKTTPALHNEICLVTRERPFLLSV